MSAIWLRPFATRGPISFRPQPTPWNEDDRRNYSHALPRRLPAEVLFDAALQAAGSQSRFPGLPPGTRAAELPDVTYTLETGLLEKLGRPARESGCECERSGELQLGPVMALVNGPVLAAALADPTNDLARLEAELDDASLMEELFMRFLGRPPRPEEAEAARALLADPPGDRSAVGEALAARGSELDRHWEAWYEANRSARWEPLVPLVATTTMGAELTVEADQSLMATGALGLGLYRVEAEAPTGRIRGLRLELLPDERLPQQGPGRAPNGNLVLSELRVHQVPPGGDTEVPAGGDTAVPAGGDTEVPAGGDTAVPAGGDTEVPAGGDTAVPPGNHLQPKRAKFRSVQASHSQAGYDAALAIDGKAETGWALMGQLGKAHEAIFTLTRPLATPAGTRLIVELDQQHSDGTHLVGRFRLSVTGDEPRLTPPSTPEEVRHLLAVDELSEEQRTELQQFFRRQVGLRFVICQRRFVICQIGEPKYDK
jgi:hypothetical protein